MCDPDVQSHSTHAICSILYVLQPLYRSETDCNMVIYTNQIEMKTRSFLDYWIDKVLHISCTFYEIENFQQYSQLRKALLYVRQLRTYQKFTIITPLCSQTVFNHISKSVESSFFSCGVRGKFLLFVHYLICHDGESCVYMPNNIRDRQIFIFRQRIFWR